MLAGKNKPSFSVELIKATAVNASENNIAFPVSQIAREKTPQHFHEVTDLLGLYQTNIDVI